MPAPDTYQVWELRLLAEARQEAEWDKVAQVCWYVLCPHVTSMPSMAELNPVRRGKLERDKLSFGKLAAELTAEEHLSNEEVDRRWEELQKRWQTQEQ